jgi:hypothetical protein
MFDFISFCLGMLATCGIIVLAFLVLLLFLIIRE